MTAAPRPKEISREKVDELASKFTGEILLPGDEGYDKARRVWNGMIDKHPAIIVRCLDAGDIVRAVNFARNESLLVAVRGGGHNIAGFGTCDGGIVIDLSKMKKIEVDPALGVAKAEPGLTWGEFDKATQAHGLAVTGGLVSTTGIAGFTLGGGVGWLVRRFGLTLDSLSSVDVVTADGKIVRASLAENPDLFWGIRGAGGNFGIISSFEYKLAKVGPMILGGLVLYPLELASKVLNEYSSFAEEIPDELTTIAVLLTAPPAPFIPAAFQGKKAVAIAVCYSGSDLEAGKRVLEPILSLGEPSVNLVQPMPYVALQSMLDESAPSGILNYWKSAYLTSLGKQSIDTLISRFEIVPSPLTAIHLHLLGGALTGTGADATAFGHRDAAHIMNLVSAWTKPSESEKNIEWTRDSFSAMAKFTDGGVYVNFLGEEGKDRIVSAYGEEKYANLVKLKTKYDPSNLFRVNQNIAPKGQK